jgi:hypothetical protein
VKREEITLLAAKAAAVSPGVCTNKRGSSYDSVTITGLPFVELNSCYTYAQLDDNELPIFLTSDRKSGIVQTGTYLEDTKVRIFLQLRERACAHVYVLDALSQQVRTTIQQQSCIRSAARFDVPANVSAFRGSCYTVIHTCLVHSL